MLRIGTIAPKSFCAFSRVAPLASAEVAHRPETGGNVSRRGFLFAGGAALAAACLPGELALGNQADTSRAARDDATRSIPFDKLTAQTRRLLEGVVSKPSIFRRMPIKTIACEPEMFVFLVRNPDVVVGIWEVMGISNVAMERTGTYTFKATDKSGTVSDIQLVYGTPEMHVVYGEGTYTGPMFRNPVHGRCVLVLKSGYNFAGASPQVINRLDMFLQIDNAGVDLIARTFQPMIGKSTDANFFETNDFVSRIWQASRENGPGVQQLADRLASVQPEIRRQFADVAGSIYERRLAEETGGSAPKRTERAASPTASRVSDARSNGARTADLRSPAPRSSEREAAHSGSEPIPPGSRNTSGDSVASDAAPLGTGAAGPKFSFPPERPPQLRR